MGHAEYVPCGHMRGEAVQAWGEAWSHAQCLLYLGNVFAQLLEHAFSHICR